MNNISYWYSVFKMGHCTQLTSLIHIKIVKVICIVNRQSQKLNTMVSAIAQTEWPVVKLAPAQLEQTVEIKSARPSRLNVQDRPDWQHRKKSARRTRRGR